MIDEYGKANPAVKNALLRVILERKIGGYELHPDSIIFATTNLGAEGVGDSTTTTRTEPHHVVSPRVNLTTWSGLSGASTTVSITHYLVGVRTTRSLFHSFEDVKDPDDNPYIYHPKQQRTAFVTPRSLEAASDWLKYVSTSMTRP
jgi:hypothetical protein